jgi:hypothetical protein
MKPDAIEFIYQAMNEIASGKHNPEMEQCLADAIEEELLAINAGLMLPRWRQNNISTPEIEAYLA